MKRYVVPGKIIRNIFTTSNYKRDVIKVGLDPVTIYARAQHANPLAKLHLFMNLRHLNITFTTKDLWDWKSVQLGNRLHEFYPKLAV